MSTRITKKMQAGKKFVALLVITTCTLALGLGFLLINQSPQTSSVIKDQKNELSAQSCVQNRADTCVNAPSVDLYPAGSEDVVNPYLRSRSDDTIKGIEGVITASEDKKLTLQTSSGRIFTITYPEDVISWWNENISPNYNNYKIDIGNTIHIDYMESTNESGTSISKEQIFNSTLLIDPATPTNQPIQRYKQ